MTSIYLRYQQQFTNDMEAIKTKLAQDPQSLQHFKELRQILTQCEKNIKLMQTELSSDSSQKSKYSNNFRAHRQEYETIKKQLYRRENQFQHAMNKKQLMSTRPNSNEIIKDKQRTLNVNERLKESVNVMYENLEISENVEEQLGRQSLQIKSSTGKVRQIRNDLVKGQRKIKSMMMRIRKNKLVLRGIITFIVIALIIIVVSYFRS